MNPLKLFICIAVAAVVVAVTVYGTIGYVAYHFIQKFW